MELETKKCDCKINEEVKNKENEKLQAQSSLSQEVSKSINELFRIHQDKLKNEFQTKEQRDLKKLYQELQEEEQSLRTEESKISGELERDSINGIAIENLKRFFEESFFSVFITLLVIGTLVLLTLILREDDLNSVLINLLLIFNFVCFWMTKDLIYLNPKVRGIKRN